ncbi:hypothetical protein GCM10011586_40090 [Silvibacterium dinghuense]|nr:hypothetical protein GCM10011586_40090 [Silvibacterium dinghuense]
MRVCYVLSLQNNSSIQELLDRLLKYASVPEGDLAAYALNQHDNSAQNIGQLYVSMMRRT